MANFYGAPGVYPGGMDNTKDGLKMFYNIVNRYGYSEKLSAARDQANILAKETFKNIDSTHLIVRIREINQQNFPELTSPVGDFQVQIDGKGRSSIEAIDDLILGSRYHVYGAIAQDVLYEKDGENISSRYLSIDEENNRNDHLFGTYLSNSADIERMCFAESKFAESEGDKERAKLKKEQAENEKRDRERNENERARVNNIRERAKAGDKKAQVEFSNIIDDSIKYDNTVRILNDIDGTQLPVPVWQAPYVRKNDFNRTTTQKDLDSAREILDPTKTKRGTGNN